MIRYASNITKGRTCWQNACRSYVDYALTKMAGDRATRHVIEEFAWTAE
jgi:hypothetical protein